MTAIQGSQAAQAASSAVQAEPAKKQQNFFIQNRGQTYMVVEHSQSKLVALSCDRYHTIKKVAAIAIPIIVAVAIMLMTGFLLPPASLGVLAVVGLILLCVAGATSGQLVEALGPDNTPRHRLAYREAQLKGGCTTRNTVLTPKEKRELFFQSLGARGTTLYDVASQYYVMNYCLTEGELKDLPVLEKFLDWFLRNGVWEPSFVPGLQDEIKVFLQKHKAEDCDDIPDHNLPSEEIYREVLAKVQQVEDRMKRQPTS